ncbi:MAG: serine/threonine protein phosphatase [Hyphomicrobiales bacterium]|nr:serine/threonine protein phosphatase [Hyphomicrobiales bacterium]
MIDLPFFSRPKDKPKAAAPARPAPAAPPGLRIYAIGDIHGRSDLLDELAAQIAHDLATSRPQRAVTIFVGDYVDRGPDSAGVIERLSARRFPTPILALRGNHEEVLLNFLRDPNVMENWRKFGGMETLVSYGVDVSAAVRRAGYDDARDAFLERLPPAHLKFLQETHACVTYGDYFFCHAGVRPGVPLNMQKAEDLMWIRSEFMGYEGDFGKVIVHGHTPKPEPEVLPNRINVDTGAFATATLTALVLEGVEQRFLSTARHAPPDAG